MHPFTLLDYAVVAAYVTAALAIGLYHARREQKSVVEYFVANRSTRTWAVVISAIASGLSAISYLGAPAWVFQHDLQLNVVVFILPVLILLVVWLFVPLFSRHHLLTIFEYLEMRFSVAVRAVASALFLILRGGWLATAIYAQSIVLSELAGIPMRVCAPLVGLLTASYTVLGGLKSVLWTEVMQFFVLISGLAAIIISVLISFGGDAGEVWRLAAAGGHTRWINPQFSFSQITVWAVVLSYPVDVLATYGSNQVMVQRFLSARSPAEMRRSVLFTGVVTVPVVVLLMLVGLALAAYYAAHPELRATLAKPDRVVPHFIGNVLPPGVAGLVVASVFAATMSVLSAGFHSLSTATVVDFIQRFGRGQRDASGDASGGDHGARGVRLARAVTLAWALITTAAALFVERLGDIVEIFGKISGFFSGPILGVFLLGILVRRVSSAGALAGLAIGVALTWWVTMTNVSWLWYGPAGLAATFLTGSAAGVLLPARANVAAAGTPQAMPSPSATPTSLR
jgi:SSS family transporter